MKNKLRAIEAFEMAINGKTHKEIGEALGFSASYARRLISESWRLLILPQAGYPMPVYIEGLSLRDMRKHPKYWLGLAAKARNHASSMFAGHGHAMKVPRWPAIT